MQPLFGLGGDKRALFLLREPATSSGRLSTDSVGTALQVALLIAVLLLIFQYSRKLAKTAGKP
jgi:hypothetical protein